MIAVLLNLPRTPEEWGIFAYHNNSHHAALTNFIFVNKTTRIQSQVLDPMNMKDIGNWLGRHAQSHDDINNTLGLPGLDLSRFDLDNENEMNAWLYQHWSEHTAFAQATGVWV